MTRVYRIRYDYANGEPQWRALKNAMLPNSEDDPLDRLSESRSLLADWTPPICNMAHGKHPEPDMLELLLDWAVNTETKSLLEPVVKDQVEFLPLRITTGALHGPGPVSNWERKLLKVINWWLKPKLDNADRYWLIHPMVSVAPDPHRPEIYSYGFSCDPNDSLDALTFFRVRKHADSGSRCKHTVYATDLVAGLFARHNLSGVRFEAVYNTQPGG